MDAPTPDQLRARSGLLTQRYADDDGGPNDEALTVYAEEASALVSSLTCRAIGEGAEGTEVPTSLLPLALRAVTMKVEQLVTATGSARERKRSLSAGNVQSFSAGPYSESYFGPGAAREAKMLDPDVRLHEILWALATEDCRLGWLAVWGGEDPPASALTAYEYGMRPGGY